MVAGCVAVLGRVGQIVLKRNGDDFRQGRVGNVGHGNAGTGEVTVAGVQEGLVDIVGQDQFIFLLGQAADHHGKTKIRHILFGKFDQSRQGGDIFAVMFVHNMG